MDGRRLAERREGRKLSQFQLAMKTGVTVQTISGIEQNPEANPYVETVRSLAIALETTVDDLIGLPPKAKEAAAS